MLGLPVESNRFFDKEKIYSQTGAINADGNTWGEYFLKTLRLRTDDIKNRLNKYPKKVF